MVPKASRVIERRALVTIASARATTNSAGERPRQRPYE